MKIESSIELFQKLERVRYLNRELDSWSARGLQKILSYAEWRSFRKVIQRAEVTCRNAGYPLRNHFAKYRKWVKIGKSRRRKIEDIGLSRYACYLITQNINRAENLTAFMLSYFSTQKRSWEIIEHRLLNINASPGVTKSKKRL